MKTKDRYFLKWKDNDGQTIIKKITDSRALFLLNAATIFQTDDFYECATDVIYRPAKDIILTEMKRHEEKRSAWKAKQISSPDHQTT